MRKPQSPDTLLSMPTRNPTPISAVIITKNEEKNLARALRSLAFCDEIVVVDSGSTDRTCEIARSFGCTVIDHPFERFGEQKSYAARSATHDWVFSLDADEEVTPELAREILQEIRNPGRNGLWIRSRLVFLGRAFRFGRESRVRVLRIFRKSAGDFDRASVHEKVVLQNPNVMTTKHHIHHFSYPDLELYLEKMNRYTTLGAQALKDRASVTGAFVQALLTPLKFLQFYLLHLNFLNGWEGFCWSVLSTHAYFIKYLKLMLLLRR